MKVKSKTKYLSWRAGRGWPLWTLLIVTLLSLVMGVWARGPGDQVERGPGPAPALAVTQPAPSARYVPDADEWERAHTRWQGAMVEFARRNASERHPEDAILFMGSSSIRLWDTLAEDVAPYHAIQRGFGGADFSDLAIFAETILAPHRYRGVVIFVANSLVRSAEDELLDQVIQQFESIVDTVERLSPGTPVFLIAVTPTELRWDIWPGLRALNTALREICEAQPGLHWIETEAAFLNEDGRPRAELFVDDRLHLNRQGYAVWSGLIRTALDNVFN